jgi:hypothetical protein
LIVIADHDQDRLVIFPTFQLFNFFDSALLERIRAQSVKGVGAKSNDAAIVDYGRSVLERFV